MQDDEDMEDVYTLNQSTTKRSVEDIVIPLERTTSAGKISWVELDLQQQLLPSAGVRGNPLAAAVEQEEAERVMESVWTNDATSSSALKVNTAVPPVLGSTRPSAGPPSPLRSKNSIFFQDFTVLPSSKREDAQTREQSQKRGESQKTAAHLAWTSLQEQPSPRLFDTSSHGFAGASPSAAISSMNSPFSMVASSIQPSADVIMTEHLVDSPMESSPSKNSIFDLDFGSAPKRAPLATSQSVEPVFTATDIDVASNDQSLLALMQKVLPEGSDSLRMYLLQPSFSFLEGKEGPFLQSRLFLFPTQKNYLGEGRFAKVFKATYVDPVKPEASEQTCVVKSAHDHDHEARLNAGGEVVVMHFLQTRFGTHENIVRLLGVKIQDQDELRFVQNATVPPSAISSLVDQVRDLSLEMQSKGRKFMNDIASASMNIAPSIVLEYVPRGTLHDFLRNEPAKCSKRQWISWSRKLARAIAFLHDPTHGVAILHLDIKPQNILLDDMLEPKLSDFGSAAFVDVPTNGLHVINDGLGRGTQGTQMLGYPSVDSYTCQIAYSAPEILTPPSFSFSTASDIYSLGCTFYTMLVGREPFQDIQNAAHQMWCIRRGFWESGANPLLTPERTTGALNGSRKAVFVSRSVPGQRSAGGSSPAPHSTTSSSARSSFSHSTTTTLPLLRFTNGEHLHAHLEQDQQAFERIVKVLQACTSPNVKSRWTARQVVDGIERLDPLLLPGVGIQI